MNNPCPIISTCLLSSYCQNADLKNPSTLKFETFKKGERINSNKNRATYVILSGIGKVTFSLGNNEVLDLILLGKGQVYGELLPFIQEKISVEFWAFTDIQVCRIKSRSLLNYAKQNPWVLFDLLKASGNNYSASVYLRWIKNAPKLFEQMLRFLIVIDELSDKSVDAPIKLTHDDIALILNADRSSVSLILEKLKKEGLVEIGYRKIYLKKDSFAISKLRQELTSISQTSNYVL